MRLGFAWLAVAATLAGCCPPTQPSPPESRPASAPGPPGFPDLSAFIAVDPKNYVRPLLKTQEIRFTTSMLTCFWRYQDDSPLPLVHLGVSCDGTIPAMPDGATAPSGYSRCDGVTLATHPDVQMYTFGRGTGGCPAPPNEFRLTPGTKLSSSGNTCVVLPDGVACIDVLTNNGFVVSSAGSWSF